MGVALKDRIVVFKSDTPNFYNEESGRKSNTVRKPNGKFERCRSLEMMRRTCKYGKIQIIHNQLPSETFTRRITDVSYFAGYMIISWKHKTK